MTIPLNIRLICLLSLLPFLIPAQNSSDSLSVSANFLSPDSLHHFQSVQNPDTSLLHIHRYDLPPFFQSHGNTGRPSQSLIFETHPLIRPDFFQESFQTSRISLNTIPYLFSLKPYSRLSYVQGANKEQQFSIQHTQKIYGNFNGTILFKTLKAPGAFSRQKANNSNFFINVNYVAKNQVYRAYLSYLHNILKLDENGGIQNDSLIEYKTETNMRVIPVNLNAAQNRFRENQYFLQQDIRLMRISDSLATSLKTLLPTRLSLVSILGNEAYIYEDAEGMSGYYPVFPADSGSILDSVRIKRIRNIARISNLHETNVPIWYHFGLEHSYSEVIFPGNGNSIYRSIQPMAGIRIRLPFRLFLQASAVASIDQLSEDRQQYGMITTSLNHKFSTHGGFQFFYTQSKSRPNVFDSRYMSTLFNWNHSLYPIQSRELGFKASYNWIKLGFRSFELNQAVYYLPENAYPWQSNEKITGIHAFGGLRLKFGPVQLDQEVHYQKLNTDAIIHLPEIMSNHQLSLEIMMFKKALVFHPGLELTFIQSYFADRYQPATRTFYIQNEQKTADQLYLDFFINLRISRARIFLKYEHLNDQFATRGSFSAPSYPAAPAAFKFGIDWVLR